MAVAAVFDAVVHAPEHAGGVFDAFFVADLAAARLEIGYLGALVVGGDFKGAAGAGGGFFKDQRDVFAAQALGFAAGFFGGFQFGGQIEQGVDLVGGEIGKFEQVARVVHFFSLCSGRGGRFFRLLCRGIAAL